MKFFGLAASRLDEDTLSSECYGMFFICWCFPPFVYHRQHNEDAVCLSHHDDTGHQEAVS